MNKLLTRLVGLALLLSPVLVVSRGVGSQAPVAAETGSQAGVWKTYTNGDYVPALAADGNYVWAATDGGGVVRWDIRDRSYAQYQQPQDGLASNSVQEIAVDGQGRVWIGTWGDGASVFDGSTWTTYNTDNSGLASNWISGIASNAQRRLWFYGAEVSAFDGSTWVTYPSVMATIEAEYGQILTSLNNDLWTVAPATGQVWTRLNMDDGVSVFDGSTWTTYNTDNSGLAGDDVRAIAIDNQGRVWFGLADGGVSVFDGSAWTTYTVENTARRGEQLTTVLEDTPAGTTYVPVNFTHQAFRLPFYDAGYVMFGTDPTVYARSGFVGVYAGRMIIPISPGLQRDVAAGTPVYTVERGLASNEVRAIVVDAQGRMWFGTSEDGAGVSVFDGSTWTTYDTNNSALASNDVLAITVDSQGQVWVGTDGYGVSVFDGTTWTTHTTLDCVRDILLDSHEQVWFGTCQGVQVFDGSVWRPAYDIGVEAMAIDMQGRMWFGTWDGVRVFDGSMWTTYDACRSGIASNLIRDVTIGGLGHVWVGTMLGGVSVFNGEAWTTYGPWNSGLAHNKAHAIALDGQGRMWFGTWGGGVSVFDGSTWTTYNTGNSGLAGNYVEAITIDGQGRVWIGTDDDGVSVFDGGTWTTYNTDNSGLASNYVTAIAFDDQGRVWFGTSFEGVSVFDGSSWTTYNTDNSGLASNYVTAIAFDDQGRVWFGLENGVSVFEEDDARSAPKPAVANTPSLVSSSTSRPGTTSISTPDSTKVIWRTYANGDNVRSLDVHGNHAWVGTWGGGVVRWDMGDGSRRQYLRPQDGLLDNGVYDVAIDAQGRVWSGTDYGVSVLDGSVGRAYTPSNSSLDEGEITELVVDNQGRVWMGRAWVSECGNGFVSVFDGDTWKAYCTGYGPMDTAADAQGRVWFAMRDGVLVFDECTWTYHYMGWLSYPGRITVNADGRVWVSAKGGVWVFDGGTWAVHPDVKATIEAEYDAVLRTIREKNDLWAVEPSTGKVWITEGDGVSVFDGSTWTTYTVDNSGLIDDDVRAMAIDEQGRAWFWTLRGVSVFDGSSWTTYDTRRSSLVAGPISAIAIDDQGRLWVGSADRDDCYITCIDGGVSVFDGSTWTTYNTSNSDLAGDSVQAIASDGQGRMWFGTYGGGVSVFDGSTWTTYDTSNSDLVDNDVVAITNDGQGRMWFGTWSDGVSVFDGSTWTTYGGYQVRAIVSDEQGRIWLGTYGDGVSVFDGSTWTTYDTGNSGLADDDVQAVASDGQGRMWFGTRGGGVSVFDGSTWTTYNTSNSGLASNSIRAITSDGQGRMWFGTNRGVSVFDGSTWTTYSRWNSGLVDSDVRAIASHEPGRMWFGTERGVSVFMEVEVIQQVYLPLVMRHH